MHMHHDSIASYFTQPRYPVPFHGIVHVLAIHIKMKSCQLVIALSTIIDSDILYSSNCNYN